MAAAPVIYLLPGLEQMELGNRAPALDLQSPAYKLYLEYSMAMFYRDEGGPGHDLYQSALMKIRDLESKNPVLKQLALDFTLSFEFQDKVPQKNIDVWVAGFKQIQPDLGNTVSELKSGTFT